MEIGQLPGLEGKAALIVGGGYGIGRSVARLLVKQKVRIAVVDLDAERVRAAEDELGAVGVHADVQQPGAARQAVEVASNALAKLDILINIVGKGAAMPATQVSAELERSVLERNFLHHIEFCSAFSQQALAAGRPGVITMVSSLSGVVPFPEEAAYGAAKAALNSYCANLAVELAPKHIRVNAVAPGVVRTDRNPMEGEQAAGFLPAIPMGRFADQSEIAAVIAFLCSDMASYITAQTLVIDGGAGHYSRFWRNGRQ